jgi:hypothetical protein
MQVLTILIVVTVLLFLSVSDSVISAARTGRSKSQDSRPQTKHQGP